MYNLLILTLLWNIYKNIILVFCPRTALTYGDIFEYIGFAIVATFVLVANKLFIINSTVNERIALQSLFGLLFACIIYYLSSIFLNSYQRSFKLQPKILIFSLPLIVIGLIQPIVSNFIKNSFTVVHRAFVLVCFMSVLGALLNAIIETGFPKLEFPLPFYFKLLVYVYFFSYFYVVHSLVIYKYNALESNLFINSLVCFAIGLVLNIIIVLSMSKIKYGIPSVDASFYFVPSLITSLFFPIVKQIFNKFIFIKNLN